LKYVTFEELLSRIADVVVRVSERRTGASVNDQHHHQLNSVLNILPKLVNGLDLNVRFSGVTDFEFTEEISVFDALDIPLVHGWVLDPQDRATASIIGPNVTYNHIIFKLVEYRSLLERRQQQSQQQPQSQSQPQQQQETAAANASLSADLPTTSSGSNNAVGSPTGDLGESGTGNESNVTATATTAEPEQIQLTLAIEGEPAAHSEPSSSSLVELTPEQEALLVEGPVIEAFLTDTASQFTYIGLLSLHHTLKERQLAVFFRNNHFSTVFRMNKTLYNLVTDQGYLDEPAVVWEQLDEIDG
jgi:hypothetical protein